VAFGGFSTDRAHQPMAEINVVPLVDVMLVLLVIFIVTAPLLTHAVKLDLPRASSSPDVAKPDTVQVSIDAQGTVYWSGEAVNRAGWRARMTAAAMQDPTPELRLRADGAVAYREVARVLSDAASAGLGRIGFVTEPGRTSMNGNDR
jgi:biopolymer transport protein ExbD